MKIPEYFIEYLNSNMDTNYKFSLDTEKGLLEQDYMVETKALIVKLYEKYFAPESEKEFWNEYHKLCFNMIEEQKKRKIQSRQHLQPKYHPKNHRKHSSTTTSIFSRSKTRIFCKIY